MYCPQCNSANFDAAYECQYCGLIFSKWRGAPPRPTLPADSPDFDSPTVPRWVIPIAVVVFLVAGVVWTKHRRDARAAAAQRNAGMLDEINRGGAEARENFATLGSPDGPRDSGANKSDIATPPPSRESIVSMIESCDRLQERVEIRLPRSFPEHSCRTVLGTYPQLDHFVEAGLAELDPPLALRSAGSGDRTINVKITAEGSARLNVRDGGETWDIDLGRRVVRLDGAFVNHGTVGSMRFQWDFENDPQSVMRHSPAEYSGSADFAVVDGEWRIATVALRERGMHSIVCRW